jgi:anthranilate phosphoribosyltransferase
VSEGKSGVVSSFFVSPEEFGLRRVALKELVGGTAEENARITKEILNGTKGAKRDIVCLNAAPAFVAGCKAKTLQDGFRLAARTIDSGAAARKLDQLIAFTTRQGARG